EPAVGVLHHVTGRRSGRSFAGASSRPTVELCAALASITRPTAVDELRRALHVSEGVLLQAVSVLEAVDAIEMSPSGVIRPSGRAWTDTEPDVAEHLAQRGELLRTRSEMVEWFVESGACRWATVLGYLGQPGHPPCGRCDACRAGLSGTGDSSGEEIHHASFGDGTVVQRRGDVIVALFAEHGYRTLSASVLQAENLATFSGDGG